MAAGSHGIETQGPAATPSKNISREAAMGSGQDAGKVPNADGRQKYAIVYGVLVTMDTVAWVYI